MLCLLRKLSWFPSSGLVGPASRFPMTLFIPTVKAGILQLSSNWVGTENFQTQAVDVQEQVWLQAWLDPGSQTIPSTSSVSSLLPHLHSLVLSFPRCPLVCSVGPWQPSTSSPSWASQVENKTPQHTDGALREVSLAPLFPCPSTNPIFQPGKIGFSVIVWLRSRA